MPLIPNSKIHTRGKGKSSVIPKNLPNKIPEKFISHSNSEIFNHGKISAVMQNKPGPTVWPAQTLVYGHLKPDYSVSGNETIQVLQKSMPFKNQARM